MREAGRDRHDLRKKRPPDAALPTNGGSKADALPRDRGEPPLTRGSGMAVESPTRRGGNPTGPTARVGGGL